jgi:uncharacterized cupredoxin-like copper-binding protein
MMLNRFQLTLALIIALTMPTLATASGAGNHSHAAPAGKYKGHAAALGKPASVSEATKTVEIELGDSMRFKPERLEIKQGETVRFVVHNPGQIKHEMVLGTMAELKEHAKLMARFPEMEHDDPNAVSVEPGKTGEFAWTFTKPGRFDFGCLVPGHFEAGMKGRIIVTK